jgi:hypothetical protein
LYVYLGNESWSECFLGKEEEPGHVGKKHLDMLAKASEAKMRFNGRFLAQENQPSAEKMADFRA